MRRRKGDAVLSDKNLPELADAGLDWAAAGGANGAEWAHGEAHAFDGVMWRRVVAFLIDLAIIGVILTALWALVFLTFGLLSGVLLPLMPIVPVAYHTLMIGGPRSATIGMQFMSIEVRGVAGERPGLLQAFAMTALFYFSIAVTSMLILIVALFNDRRRLAHDFLSGTLVVNTDALA